MNAVKSVTIIGSGPAGGTLAYLLKKGGLEVEMYDAGIKPDLIVGESQIPAGLEIIRELGLEDEVKKIGRHKQGAVLYLNSLEGFENEKWEMRFDNLPKDRAQHAYNVNRNEFDELFNKLARSVGVEIKKDYCPLIKDGDEAVKFESSNTKKTDLIIDATGRARYLPKLLNLDSTTGKRKDKALFAHFSKAELPHNGSIHMNILPNGWTWRIPLQDRVSIGIVTPEESLVKYGSSPEEQLEGLINDYPYLKEAIKGKRISPVMKYENYQNRTNKLYGPNWALVGDSAGFVDPVFSSGVYLSLKGAKLLAEALLQNGTDGLAEYQEIMKKKYARWQDTIDSFYDGRFFSLICMGLRLRKENPQALERVDNREVITKILSGTHTMDEDSWKEYNVYLEYASRIQ